jgi:hypothetical protein
VSACVAIILPVVCMVVKCGLSIPGKIEIRSD